MNIMSLYAANTGFKPIWYFPDPIESKMSIGHLYSCCRPAEDKVSQEIIYIEQSVLIMNWAAIGAVLRGQWTGRKVIADMRLEHYKKFLYKPEGSYYNPNGKKEETK